LRRLISLPVMVEATLLQGPALQHLKRGPGQLQEEEGRQSEEEHRLGEGHRPEEAGVATNVNPQITAIDESMARWYGQGGCWIN